MPYAVISTTSVSGETCFSAREQLDAGRARHHQIGQHHVHAVLAHELERGLGALGGEHAHALALEDLLRATSTFEGSSSTTSTVIVGRVGRRGIEPATLRQSLRQIVFQCQIVTMTDSQHLANADCCYDPCSGSRRALTIGSG